MEVDGHLQNGYVDVAQGIHVPVEELFILKSGFQRFSPQNRFMSNNLHLLPQNNFVREGCHKFTVLQLVSKKVAL